MRYQWISESEELYSVQEMRSVLELSRSGYYAWKGKKPSARALEDEPLKEAILEVYERARGRYGHRAIHSHLVEQGLDCGRDRVLRLMREMGILGDQSPRCKPLGTDSDHDCGYSANLLKENGAPSRCDEVWVADTTYLKIEGCWMYLAVVMDLFSRRILGWSLSRNNDAQLVCQALLSAKGNCYPAGAGRRWNRFSGASKPALSAMRLRPMKTS